MLDRKITGQITFIHSNNLKVTREFYTEKLGLILARDQGSCLIFQVTETAYLGFCEHIEPLEPGRKVILTLVSNDVDKWYEYLKNIGVEIMAPPKASPLYGIYHFFMKDPDGYLIEIQRFDESL